MALAEITQAEIKAIRRELVATAVDPFQIAAQAMADVERHRRRIASLEAQLQGAA
jgi:hypothetical protein